MTENEIEIKNIDCEVDSNRDETTDITLPKLDESITTMQLIDTLLKTPDKLVGQIIRNKYKRSISILLFIASIGFLIYGMIVGSFSGNTQWIAAPAKIILGSVISSLLCFPSLYIFACLSGASINPTQALALIGSGMALTAILLLGFAPVAFIFTFSIEALFFMGMIHLLVWGVSMFFGLRYIFAGLATMSCRDKRLLKVWGGILIVTMLQMSTTLRPIIGESDQIITSEKRSFIEHWIKNSQPKSTSFRSQEREL